MDVAKTRLTSEESVLSSLTEVFQRLSELAIQGANGTMASEDRLVLAAEVSELRKEVFRLGNTKDLDGNYLFQATRSVLLRSSRMRTAVLFTMAISVVCQ